MRTVIIYTDGSCSMSSGRGGYGAVIINGADYHELFGGFTDTTNNRMELMAVIKALQTLEPDSDVVVYSDSQYVVNAFNKRWLEKWKRQNWNGRKNSDLWQALYELTGKMRVNFSWVKGHNGNLGNERADELAKLGAGLKKIPLDKKPNVKTSRRVIS